MTVIGEPSTLDIMANARVRKASDSATGVVVLSLVLDRVVFADAAGLSLLGGRPDAALSSLLGKIPMVARQVLSAVRPLAQRGAAHLLLRTPMGAAARPVAVDLLRLDIGDAGALVLLTGREPVRSHREADRAAELLRAARIDHQPAAIFSASARLDGMNAFPVGTALQQAAADFLASGDDLVSRVVTGMTITFARVGEDRAILRVDGQSAAAIEEPAMEAPVAEPSPPGGFSTFSVKRGKLPGGRAITSMGAVVARWHGRKTSDVVDEPAEGAASFSDRAEAPTHDPSFVDLDAMPVNVLLESQFVAPVIDVASSTEPEPAHAAVDPQMPQDDIAQTAPDAEGDDAAPRLGESADVEALEPVPDASAESEAEPAGDMTESCRSPEDSAVDLAPNDGIAGEDAQVSLGDDSLGRPADSTAAEMDPGHPDAAVANLSEEAPLQTPAASVLGGDATLPTIDGPSRFEPRFGTAPIRFVWQIDRDGTFRSLSADFGAAVGPRAADVIGRTFRDVAQVFDFDGNGEIARLLDRRDTWSGRSILWPVEGSNRKVPVDLAALPVYARDRSFDGFRGFGIVRMNEAVDDPADIGLILAGLLPAPMAPALVSALVGAMGPETAVSHSPEMADPAATRDAAMTVNRPVMRKIEIEASGSPVFGRRAAPPGEQPAQGEAPQGEASQDNALEPIKVIRLEERRRPRDGTLSHAEEAAFRAIGAKLGHVNKIEAESPGALRFEEPTEAGMPGEALEPSAAYEAVAAGDDAPGDSDADEPETPVGEPDAPVAERTTRDDAEHAAEADPLVVGRASQDLFAELPLPVLVQVQEQLVYANREFERLTGYGDVAALTQAGGLDRLFAEREDGSEGRDGEIAIRRADGTCLDMRVHMQRVTLAERSSLLISFAPAIRDQDAPVREAPIVEPAEEPDRALGEPPSFDTAEGDLRTQVEELRTVLDTATDGIVLLDPPGHIRSMNGSANALFGIGDSDQTGRHLSSLFAHESQRAVVDYLEMLRDNGLAGILNDGREVVGRVAQGGFIPLFITIGRLPGERGWCVVIRDIAHWKRIEEELVNARRQAEAASLHKSRFLANISHELRTPLNAIIGFADVMASECFGPIGNERYLEYLGDIKRSGHHVLDLVNDLLDISKIEAGKIDLAFEAVSLNEVVAEVVSLMQPQANRERVIVRSNLPSSVPPVVADRRTIRQIALNLIANAVRFTPAGGQIIASTTYTAEGDVVLRFRDSGIGMTEHEIEIALTPFQQVHSPGSGRGEGTGLGLPLTKAMVEANRALFSIASTPGEGTLVEISFPSQRVLAD